ncbi:glutamine amidotransferase-related protein [Maritalea mediterranea]|uniref:Gamma-glutamyl-gamma-aminobutyrate hydrolase family protein n=1 Tax=Maritalea mediterranea TaxID=2909667 RepID=A0ABS9E7U7_9HYPH|nr:gamma-glutamyl-gamma-aminobutyrate hydrolase family protein [Maritalea mediterranea]MCF4097503.1 gamma-glutamyl-gamma-aminobutyrate hydrolase family protein [Maritalea mediterranea]
MKITILQTGLVPEPLREAFPTYGEMMQIMLKQAGGEFDFRVISVVENEPLPPLDDVEALLITGSSHGVYDPLPWIDPLKTFIRAAYEQHIPMVGICFGHQIMAEALGGHAGKSEKGWGLGRHAYRLENLPEIFGVEAQDVHITASHQDQVLSPPAQAEIIARSDFTPNAGLFYPDGPAISVQPHPEFSDSFSRTLFTKRKGVVFDPDDADQALASLADPSSSALLGELFVRFFRENSSKSIQK